MTESPSQGCRTNEMRSGMLSAGNVPRTPRLLSSLLLFLAFPAEKAMSQKCQLLIGSWWPCCQRAKHFFSNETIVSCTFCMLPVSGLSMAQKCPLMRSTEAGTRKMPAGNWHCSSPVLSFQTRFRKPLWVSHPGRSGLY